MPERKNLFSQAENHRYNVSNVLSDTAYEKTDKIPPTPETETQPEINLEEGAPFLDGIDPTPPSATTSSSTKKKTSILQTTA